MSMTTADIDLIRLWCREREPQDSWGERRVEPFVTGRHIDLIAVRVAGGAESRTTFARLRYMHTGWWHLYWRDAEGTFRRYPMRPVGDVQELLDFLAGDSDPLFWVY